MTSDDLQPPTQFTNGGGGDQGDYVITQTDIGNRRYDQKEQAFCFLVKIKQASLTNLCSNLSDRVLKLELFEVFSTQVKMLMFNLYCYELWSVSNS